MGEVDTSQGGGKKGGKKRSKKMSTKIDMTPMVDLAFLLITFFMLTTTFNKPKTMEINMPDKTENKDDVAKVAASRTLTIILGKDNKIYWYHGDNNPETMKLFETDFNEQTGIRKVIMDKSKEIMAASGGKEAVILIKSMDNAKYGNLVDMLDEMHITNQKIYAIVDIYDQEKAVMQRDFPNSI
jgi:biopolymer transport protein ExbD